MLINDIQVHLSRLSLSFVTTPDSDPGDSKAQREFRNSITIFKTESHVFLILYKPRPHFLEGNSDSKGDTTPRH